LRQAPRVRLVLRRIGWLLPPACFAVGSLSAQRAVAVSAVTLERVIAAALSASPTLRISQWRSELARGALVASGAPFDNVLTSSVSTAQEYQLGLTKPDLVGAVGTSAVGTYANQYAVGISRRLRSGMLLTPQLSLVQQRLGGAPLAASSSASIELALTMPLIRDRFGRVVRAGERSAEASFAAESLEVVAMRAQTVYAVVVAYWRFVGASVTRAALVEAEARALQQVRETEALIAADERAPADLKQVNASLATRRVASLSARQTVLEAWRQVVLTTGLPAAEVLASVTPATAMPALQSGADSLSDTTINALLRQALEARGDLAAAHRRRSAAMIAADAAEGALRPRLDLVGRVGYAGLAPGADRVIGSFASTPARPNISIGVQYQLPTRNVAARGSAAQASAALRQTEIAEQDIARQVETAVLVAAAGVVTRRAALREANIAVTLSREALENERERFLLSSSTIFEVLQSQDALTNALLNEVTARVAYATAIADLRFASGSFGTVRNDAAAHDATSAVTPP
jgi:outer membrane protein